MPGNFLFAAISDDVFSKYFQMPEDELKKHGAYLFESDQCPCYPCRVSLTDAQIGETVLAISYEHHAANGPYRSSGPIFVRQSARTVKPAINEVPEMLRHRLLSLRAYNAEHLMIEAETAKGCDIETVLSQLFSNEQVQYLHVHNAGPGCFNCSVNRA